MAFLKENTLRLRAQRRAAQEGMSVTETLDRAARKRSAHYDIFLSQTIRDAEIVLGVYDLMSSAGYTVFCDWIEAPEADRSQVTPANAEFVRATMGISDTLLFLDTKGAAQSLWMCWELGWFDAAKGTVGVLPVLSDDEHYYRGREFLGLYPYIELDDDGQLKVVRPVAVGPNGIMLFEAPNGRSFSSWRTDPRDFMRPRIVGRLGR